jgi:hypothetical protein
MSEAVAAKIVSGLRDCLRDVDFIGWYSTDRIVGAALTDYMSSDPCGFEAIRQRVIQAIGLRIASRLLGKTHVHVRRVTGDGGNNG